MGQKVNPTGLRLGINRTTLYNKIKELGVDAGVTE